MPPSLKSQRAVSRKKRLPPNLQEIIDHRELALSGISEVAVYLAPVTHGEEMDDAAAASKV